MKIAVIPARGGSKRIPRKNIRPFLGKPIIAYSIEAAISCGLFDKVIVSTDDDEIANIAKSFGAETPFMRPKELADDFTGTNEIVKHAIQWFGQHGQSVGYACCIYATAPFIQVCFLKEGYEKLIALGKSFAFSVTTFPFPVQRAIRIRADGGIEPLDAQAIKKRSQDLEETFHDAGQFYWGTANAFLKGEELFSPNAAPIVVPRHLVQDIDSMEDWTMAELMYRARILMEKESA
jgi:N-acylneuraminate cytidylyltransferase